MAVMKYVLLIAVMLFSPFLFAQNVEKVEIVTQNNNTYLGTISSETEEVICIETKNTHILCFDRDSIISVEKLFKENVILPLSKKVNPYFFACDIGIEISPDFSAPIHYNLEGLKRIDDKNAFGIGGSINIGDELRLCALGKYNYQFSTTSPKVKTLWVNAGYMKELAYWSRNGYAANFGFTLLKRTEGTESRRFTISTGFTSALWNSIDDTERRITELNLGLAYGWQR